MNTNNNDIRCVQELFSILCEMQGRIIHFDLSKEMFSKDMTLAGRAYADMLLMCVFRATEEAGKISEEVRAAYPTVPWCNIPAMRNLVAYDYEKVDRAIIWSSGVENFPALKAFCRQYAEDHGIDLRKEA